MFTETEQQYKKVRPDSPGDDERLLSDHNDENQDRVARKLRGKRWRIETWSLTLLNIIIFIAYVVFTLPLLRARTTAPLPTVQQALEKTWTYSPIFDDPQLQLSLTETKMNGSVLKRVDTPWNGTPQDAEREAVWEDLQHVRVLPLTGDQVRKMGQDPRISAKLEDTYWHLGDDAYMGTMDIFHKIHCLARLRKIVLGFDNGTTTHTANHWGHSLHCVEMLMEHLLCTGDTGFMTYNWYKGVKSPQPNFSVKRQCKDWTQLVDHRDRHALPEEMKENYVKPVGVDVVELEPGEI